ncbi:MAG TPA: hypothetical protein VFP78_17555 [Solirubrobacteraceae bacterium]|nr:hypothetical protein [Solirubrobacteraceae bacterium]
MQPRGGFGACAFLGRGGTVFELGVNYPPEQRGERPFSVLAIKAKRGAAETPRLAFVLYSGSLPFEGYVFLAETSLKRLDAGKYGQRLRIRLPRELVDTAGIKDASGRGIYNALLSLDLTLGHVEGGRSLLVTTGCEKRRHPIKVVITFIDNTVTEAGRATRTAASPCTK